jgi:transcriptional regulator with GAF, ATPase, and Fis domain
MLHFNMTVYSRGPPLGNPSNITRISTLFPRCDKTEIASAFAPVASGPNGAAALLGIKPTTLESRIKKLGLVQKR